MHACIHTYRHTYTHTHSCMHACIHIHTYILIYIHIQTHIYIDTYIHTYIHTHKHIYTYIHAYIHTTHIYIHTLHIYTKTLHIYVHKHKYTLFIMESRLWTPLELFALFILNGLPDFSLIFSSTSFPSPCSIMYLLFSNVFLYKDTLHSAFFSRRTNPLHSKFIVGTSPANGT